MVAMVVEARSPVVFATVPTSPSVVDAWLRDQSRSVLVELPLPPPDQPFQESEGQPLYHQIFHWQPILNGVSGFFPASYLELLTRMDHFPDQSSVDYLRTRGVRYVVMREYLFQPLAFAQLRGRMAAQPGLTFVGRFPEQSGESDVFAVGNAGANGQDSKSRQ